MTKNIEIPIDAIDHDLWVVLCVDLEIPEEDMDGATVLCLEVEEACVN